jgi:hypothetical protein
MTDKINELFHICGINDFHFLYQKVGEENYINYEIEPEKTIVVNIVNVDDVELEKLLDNKIKELKELFK